MTSLRDRHPHLAAAPGSEQLRLTLPERREPALHDVPAQLRLDARTRRVGRAGIAELRRILAEGDQGAARAA
jgi:hypothetical protein